MKTLTLSILAAFLITSSAATFAQQDKASDQSKNTDRTRAMIERRAVDCVLGDAYSGPGRGDQRGDPVCDMLHSTTRGNPNTDYAGPPSDVIHAGNTGRTESSVTFCNGSSALNSSEGCRSRRR
ncbi:MAG: hypothetical protein LWW93_12175 [Hyphomicrobiales bacterium]|nr:hypothetical protein [Hyphomicrobiales bacterium]